MRDPLWVLAKRNVIKKKVVYVFFKLIMLIRIINHINIKILNIDPTMNINELIL